MRIIFKFNKKWSEEKLHVMAEQSEVMWIGMKSISLGLETGSETLPRVIQIDSSVTFVSRVCRNSWAKKVEGEIERHRE